ncbi:MAG TPA: DUF3179 domain-containing (seleno)protein [Ohtaekwangia sp.]|uniref:DUF3179 domain-containing (seleno)protein n=1 Tax=Ohtaekwangia sp. TaxID=2066019 RepID=UPI002F9401C8
MRVLLFILGIVILVGVEILRVYFIMPFPGSQQSETIAIAYFLHSYINVFRLLGFIAVAIPFLYYFRSGSVWARVTVSVFLIVYLVVFYLFNFRFLAEKMFYQPSHKIFAAGDANKIPASNLIIGVTIHGVSKAYPIQLIGYHHQVRDTVGTTPVMITYCTVCRTGRVFSPLVDGKDEKFRLVGMDHFNAMFEDATTGSWWRQVNGEAIAGPLRGKMLEEIPSEQMKLSAWLVLHPASLVMQPDGDFKEQYDGLKNYDKGKGKSHLTKADSLSWKDKSWVVGVQQGMQARAYDWNDLLQHTVLQDTLAGSSLLITLEADSASFHVFDRDTLRFEYDPSARSLRDVQTASQWNLQGHCEEGVLKDRQLPVVQSYQEFWHSWRTFRPQTTTYKVDAKP